MHQCTRHVLFRPLRAPPHCLPCWLPACPPISLTSLSLFDLEPLLGWPRGFLFVGFGGFVVCSLLPFSSLKFAASWPLGQWPFCELSGRAAHTALSSGRLFHFHLGLLVWIGSIVPAGLIDGLIDNQVDPCSAGWHAPYFTGWHLMRIKEVVRSSEQPIKTIKREEWKMRF